MTLLTPFFAAALALLAGTFAAEPSAGSIPQRGGNGRRDHLERTVPRPPNQGRTQITTRTAFDPGIRRSEDRQQPLED